MTRNEADQINLAISEFSYHRKLTDSDITEIFEIMEGRREYFEPVFAGYIAHIRSNPYTYEPLRDRFFTHVDSRDDMNGLVFDNPKSRPHDAFNMGQGILSLGRQYKQGVILPITSVFKPGVQYDKYRAPLNFKLGFEGYDVYPDHISARINFDSRVWYSAYPVQYESDDYISFMTADGVARFLMALKNRKDWANHIEKLGRTMVYNGSPDERESLLGVLTNTQQGLSFLTASGIDIGHLASIDLASFPDHFYESNSDLYTFLGWNN